MPASLLLSIVCPAYQEEDVLPMFHASLVKGIEPLVHEFGIEILYVDDGSRDTTLSVIRRLTEVDPRVRYLSLSRNFGHQVALTAGLEHARGDAVVSLDTDLQHPPSLIPELVAQWQRGFDVVLTIRADDRRLSWFKRATSRLFYRILGWCSRLDVRPSASDFRLLSRSAVEALRGLRESHRYLRGMVQWLGFRVAEVPFQPDARQAGVSKYTLRRMVRFALDGLLSFSPVPARAAAVGGLTLAAISWFISMIAIVALAPIRDSLTQIAMIGLTAIHILAAGMFMTIAMLGEYLIRIYDQAKNRPLYVLKEKSAETTVLTNTLRSPRAA